MRHDELIVEDPLGLEVGQNTRGVDGKVFCPRVTGISVRPIVLPLSDVTVEPGDKRLKDSLRVVIVI